MEFEWDEHKRLEVVRKHGVDLLVAALIFRGETVSRVDNRRDYGEERLITTGLVNGTCFVVVHTERDGVTRLISAWRGGRREQTRYQASIARRTARDDG